MRRRNLSGLVGPLPTGPGTHALYPLDRVAPPPLKAIEQMGPTELERLLLILRGGSPIDWRRVHFADREDVRTLLRLFGIDPLDRGDQAWLRSILEEAVGYLRSTFRYRVAEPIAHPAAIEDLFLYASGLMEPSRYRKIACIALKVMHVVQHIEARDLLFRLSISEAELLERVTEKVMAVALEMQEAALPIVEFSDSLKSRESIVTKLIAKKDTVAAQIYDKARFRIVTRTEDDLVPVLIHLTERLFPFNQALPGETENSLIDLEALIARYPNLTRAAGELGLEVKPPQAGGGRNQFSGGSYRVLNFVVDVPLRLDAYLPPRDRDLRHRQGRFGFGQVEFQMVDQQTARANEAGENAHERYKHRQKRRVLQRLSRGLVVPKGRDE